MTFESAILTGDGGRLLVLGLPVCRFLPRRRAINRERCRETKGVGTTQANLAETPAETTAATSDPGLTSGSCARQGTWNHLFAERQKGTRMRLAKERDRHPSHVEVVRLPGALSGGGVVVMPELFNKSIYVGAELTNATQALLAAQPAKRSVASNSH